MLNEQLINPKSIVIIGASNDIRKPGGKIVKNIIDGGYQGIINVVNPKYDTIQGISSFSSVNDIPKTDLAILAIPAKYCLEAITILAKQ
ncbi:MAG: CoA-binding protein, partial [Flavobacteriaceae bacterium]|nr:CoA-binding protein [Flavobacteriaceae bacterium]